MSAAPEPNTPSAMISMPRRPGDCGLRRNARETVKALIVANGFLEARVAELRGSVSAGYSRGRFDIPRDRKDWYD
jgi:hypothetical protein